MTFRAFGLTLLFLFSFSARADDPSVYDDEEVGSGFVAVEGGVWMLTGNTSSRTEDPVMLYLSGGVSLSKAFGAGDDFEPLKIGGKIGAGFGKANGGSAADTKAFFDGVMKVRYSFGSKDAWIRPFVDGGPGYVNYTDKAFQLEGGGGVEFYLGEGGTIGLDVQYKEAFDSDIDRGLVFLGSLGFHF